MRPHFGYIFTSMVTISMVPPSISRWKITLKRVSQSGMILIRTRKTNLAIMYGTVEAIGSTCDVN